MATKLDETMLKRSPCVCWEFMRGKERLICQIDRDAAGTQHGSFTVTIVPVRNPQQASVDIFRSAAAALYRHAILANWLRATGWTLAAYTSAPVRGAI